MSIRAKKQQKQNYNSDETFICFNKVLKFHKNACYQKLQATEIDSTLTEKQRLHSSLLDLRIHFSSRDNTKLMGLCQTANIHAEAFPDTIFLQCKQQ